MRLRTAISSIALVMAPTLAHGFHVAGKHATTRSSTSLAARRSIYPILRRNNNIFSEFDRVFEEMDEMVESSLATRFPRPTLLAFGRDLPEELQLRRPLGFDITQDDKEYKVAVHVPDVEAKDIDLQLDHDGRVLRLRGDRYHEDGGMKVRSRFEKAILLSPDVDTTNLAAEMTGDTLTIVAPKIEKEEALENAQSKKIKIRVAESHAALQDGKESTADIPEVPPTQLAVESLKDETNVEAKNSTEDEKRWPARDFPY